MTMTTIDGAAVKRTSLFAAAAVSPTMSPGDAALAHWRIDADTIYCNGKDDGRRTDRIEHTG
jgi:hypothetical protein